MAGISSTIRINDGMSSVLRNMNRALNIVLDSFERLQSVSANAVDTIEIQSAREALYSAGSEAERMAEEMNQISNNTDNAYNSQQRLNNSMNSGSDAMSGLLKKAVELASVYLGIHSATKLVRLSDEMSRTSSRMNLIVDDGGSVEELQRKIFNAAQRSRADFLDTSNAVTAFAQRAGNAFANNDETILFAETLNKMYKIAGASAEEQSSSMLQLTQALGSGVLRGEEFNSVFEAAPNIIQAVADYMEVPLGSLREMAQDGAISSEVVKNAIFNATEQVNQDFEGMKLTWEDVTTSIKNKGIMALQPVLDKINELANNPEVQQLGSIVLNAVTNLGIALTWLIEKIASVSFFFVQNWSNIAPVIWGITAAIGVYTIAMGSAAVYTWIATGAAKTFFTTLLTNPLFWVALVIGVVIAAIAKWVQAVGGIRIAWLMACNSILTTWDILKLGFVTGVYGVMSLIDNLSYGWKSTTVTIANFIGQMKVNVLTSLEEMINGAIDLLNDLIDACNTIPGVSIDAIAEVTFGTDAAIKEEAAKQARDAELANWDKAITAREKARENSLQTRADELVANKAAREEEIEALRAEIENSTVQNVIPEMPVVPDIPAYDDIAQTADNTDKIAKSLEVTEEDLKYLKDIAEQEAINRFTTAEIKLEMTNNNNINNDMDIDGVVSQLEDKLYESLIIAAEGVH